MAKKKKKKRAPERAPTLERLDEEIDRFLKSTVEEQEPETPSPGPADERGQAQPHTIQGTRETDEALPPGGLPLPDLELVVSDDGMVASLAVVHPETTFEQITAFLDQQGVTIGRDDPAAQKAVSTARQSGKAVKDVVVARGIDPRPPPPPSLEHLPPEGMKALPPLEPVAEVLGKEDPREASSAAVDLEVWNVDAGQV